MARQVLPIVGAVIGAYFGGPQGAQIGYAIGSLVGNAVDPLVVDGPKIGDVAQQTSSEGVYRPIVFGTAQIAGNIIAQGRTFFQIAPWTIMIPGAFLAVTVLAVNLLGDGLRDRLDPRLARRL